jgi:hypothetical protein
MRREAAKARCRAKAMLTWIGVYLLLLVDISGTEYLT